MIDKTLKKVDIFISSPGDVGEERKIASEVIEQLNSMPHIADHYLLKPLAYEKIVPAAVGESPQRAVDRYMMEANQADIFICLLWSRMGTPVIDSDGKEYQSGTEYEFIKAYQANQKSGKPTILLYRAMKNIPPDSDFKQAGYVQDFFKRFEGKDAEFRGMYGKYKNNEEFKEILRRELNVIISKNIHPIDPEIITPVPVNPPTIESVLRKGEIIKGDFFKPEPKWVDFEQGYIIERKEVDEIINNLENKRVQLVLGAPASGKSIILKNVGFKLAKDNKKVYVMELKKYPNDEIKLFFENIPKIDDKSIFIVDDAHLNLSECERLAKEFENNGKGNLIIGSRESREITKEHPKEGAEYELLNELSKTCIHVQAEDVTERMIGTFLEKQYHFNDDRIQTVSSNLDKYKNDLWLLSWALKAYNKNKDSIDKDEIYEKITDSIVEIKIGKEKEVINAEDVFLPLSIFYRYEIPIERYFLEEQLGIDGKIINQLIGLQEITETKETKMLSLHHSSIAKLYLGAYLSKSILGRRIKKNILNGKEIADLEYCSFYLYMTTIDPRNAVDVVISLERDFYDFKGGLTLLKSLIKEEKIQRSLLIGIDKEEDIYKVGIFAYNTSDADISVANGELPLKLLKLLETININSLSLKIAKEEDIYKIGYCVFGIARSRNYCIERSSRTKIKSDMSLAIALIEMTRKLMEGIDLNALSSKINKEEYIEKVGRCISDISEASEEVALKLADRIDINVLSLKIAKEEDIVKVGNFVENISFASVEVALKLLERIDFNVLSSKINKEDMEKVVWFIEYIARTSREVARNLLETIDMKSLSSRINRGEDIDKVVSQVSSIAPNMKFEIVNHLTKLGEELDKGDNT